MLVKSLAQSRLWKHVSILSFVCCPPSFTFFWLRYHQNGLRDDSKLKAHFKALNLRRRRRDACPLRWCIAWKYSGCNVITTLGSKTDNSKWISRLQKPRFWNDLLGSNDVTHNLALLAVSKYGAILLLIQSVKNWLLSFMFWKPTFYSGVTKYPLARVAVTHTAHCSTDSLVIRPMLQNL